MEEEIWKDIPGWDGLYQASSLGRIKGLERFVWNHNGYALKPEIILKPAKNNITKMTADYFRAITGWTGRTSEHARDAAMLVIGR